MPEPRALVSVGRYWLVLLMALLLGCQSRDPTALQQAHARDGLQCLVRQLLAQPSSGDIRLVRNLAEDGNPDCQLVLGRWYEAGQVVEQDYAKARALYLSAAERDPRAYLLLGRLAEEGRGEPQDYGRARQLYSWASALDEHSGKLELARLLEHGQGGAVDLPGAFDLYVFACAEFQDPAWHEVQRLRRTGLRLTAAQARHYNAVWLRGLASRTRDLGRNKQVLRIQRGRAAPADVQVMFIFKAGSPAPEVAMEQSSGEPALDDAILHAAARVRMTDDFSFAEGMDSQQIIVPVTVR